MPDSPRPAVDDGLGPSAPTTANLPTRVMVAGHELSVFVETVPVVTAMLLDIRSATTRVWLETYIFLNDTAGSAIAEAIKERAQAGVEVRVLHDAIGSQETPGWFFADLAKAGVNVHVFHSLGEAFWRFSFLRILNRRDHRKLLIVDDRVAYFGGMNIVDATSARAAHAELLPASTSWRDVHLRLVGPQQKEIADSFDRSWRKAHGERTPRRPRATRRLQLPAPAESLQFFDTGPGRGNARASRIFLRIIQLTRSQLALSMAYFLPVAGVLKALLKAPRRGVRVRVVVPGDSDVPIVQRATRYLYDRLLARRFRVYERQGHMLHSKVLVADEEWCIVGSSNLDARSLWINLEFIAVIRSRELARVLLEVIDYEIAHSRRITRREYRATGWWERLLNRLAWGLRWWL